jgi:Ca2+/Na+ antiporter
MDALFIDPHELKGSLSGIHLVFLTGCYIALLIFGSKRIASGGELLLLVPSLSKIVGGIILPILGAVPDGAMILFSGLGEKAEEQVAVGVGALSGSTIMLLTIPVFISFIGGSRPAPDSSSIISRRVEPLPYVRKASLSILITAIFYLTIQVCAFALKLDEKGKQVEKDMPIVGGIHAGLCFVGFCLYLVYQFLSAQTHEDAEVKADTLAVSEIRDAQISFRTAVYELGLQTSGTLTTPSYALESLQSSLLPIESKSNQRIQRILKPFFNLFDTDNSGTLDFSEIQLVLTALHETLPKQRVRELFDEADADHNGSIDFQEFCAMIMKWAVNPQVEPPKPAPKADEEDDEIPPDLADLPPEVQQRKIKIRAFTKLGLGLILVFLFSDPAVGCFNEIGKRTGIPAFFISFVLAPLVSNGSELLSAYVFASRKTAETISISFSTLIGAAAMNNTFCLGILLICITLKKLVWNYLSQVIGTLLVEIGVVFMVMWPRRVTTVNVILAVSMYPVSILLIWLLGRYTGHWSKI